VTGALEIARREKVIGASLEAAPTLHLSSAGDVSLLKDLDLAEISITSASQITETPAPENAFKLEDVAGVAVAFSKAEGTKCARCWKILPEVGRSRTHAQLCMRCEAAVGEHDRK
jgi:isoleucyl-tRNA synthetase